jgi:energy-coupling factor transport system ATP-binding protein
MVLKNHLQDIPWTLKYMDLQADHLSFQYEDVSPPRPVLEEISFSLKGSECAALVGPSGSGKSTLAQLLNGLLFPTRGRLLFNGKPIMDKATEWRELHRRVALVFQFPEAQIFEATVFEEVAFAARQNNLVTGQLQGRVNEALEAVGLDPAEFLTRNPMKLSGGEDRLVTIASLLVVDPDWLILDEPTLGLDYPHKRMIQALIEKRRQSGKGVLLITHDLDLALVVCPRLLALNQGRLVWEGATRKFLLEHDVAEEFGLADSETVRVWKRLRTSLPDLTIPDPPELEAWAAGLTGNFRGQVAKVLNKEIDRVKT